MHAVVIGFSIGLCIAAAYSIIKKLHQLMVKNLF